MGTNSGWITPFWSGEIPKFPGKQQHFRVAPLKFALLGDADSKLRVGSSWCLFPLGIAGGAGAEVIPEPTLGRHSLEQLPGGIWEWDVADAVVSHTRCRGHQLLKRSHRYLHGHGKAPLPGTPRGFLGMPRLILLPSCPQGRFTIAAKHHITIAEIYEAELVDIEKAIAHYEQAADYYKGEESNSSANKCLLKVAAYAAQLEQYQKAIEIYEQVGTNTMDNPLLKYSAKEYFFKAALCHFIVDELNAKLALEKYEEMFPAFTDSRECKLLKKLLEAHEEQNSEAYTEAVKEFDSISRLDQWLTTMLLRIKKTIQGEGDGDLK
uniref:NSF attachment protein beta n=1 Tax=Cyanoderma ruficeps TaxID=181631 RepID=A0A8C3QES6_9PASS